MSSLLPLILTLLMQQAPADVPAATPDPARVKEVLVGLELGFKSDDPGLLVAALVEARGVPDPAVVASVAKALKEKDADVCLAAVETLRFLQHPDALEELERFATRERKSLKDDPTLFAAILRACAQHAQKRTIEVLVADAWATADKRVFKARVLGLANIRCDESLQALVGLTNQATKNKVQPLMDDIRLALMVLTGEDEGFPLDGWWAWWNEHKKDFHVAPEMPKLPRDAELKWNAFWGSGSGKEAGGGR